MRQGQPFSSRSIRTVVNSWATGHSVLVTVAACAVVVAALGAVPAAEVRGAVEVVGRSHKDFGVVQRGQRLEHVFELRNRGTGPIRILRLRTSCGCSAATASEVVAPGQTGRVVVAFDSIGRLGPQHSRVIVHTDSPDSPIVLLEISATVEAQLEFRPAALNVGTIPPGTRHERRIELLPRRQDVSDWYVTWEPPEARDVHVDIQTSGSGNMVLHVGLEVGEHANAGEVVLAVPVTVKHGDTALVGYFQIRGEIPSEFEVFPPRIALGMMEAGRGGVAKEIRVHRAGHKPDESEIQLAARKGGVVVAGRRVEGRVVVLSVRIEVPEDVNGEYHDLLVVESGDFRQEIPVQGYVYSLPALVGE